MSSYFETWAKYATFEGRATRAEYWLFIIITPILTIIIREIGFKMGMTTEPNSDYMVRSIPGVIFGLLAIIPHIAVSVRRIHDIGLSGWWGWLFIPLILPMWIVGFIRSSKNNKYGESFEYLRSQEEKKKHSVLFEEDEIKSTISFPIKNNKSWDNLKMILIDFYQKDNFTNIISDKEFSFMLGSNDKEGYVSMNLDKNIVTIVSFKTLNIDTNIVKNEIEPRSIELTKQLHEDEIYEKIMIEVEDNNKVKSTWAKALSLSAGNKDKAESLYINLRVEDIKKLKQREEKKPFEILSDGTKLNEYGEVI